MRLKLRIRVDAGSPCLLVVPTDVALDVGIRMRNNCRLRTRADGGRGGRSVLRRRLNCGRSKRLSKERESLFRSDNRTWRRSRQAQSSMSCGLEGTCGDRRPVGRRGHRAILGRRPRRQGRSIDRAPRRSDRWKRVIVGIVAHRFDDGIIRCLGDRRDGSGLCGMCGLRLGNDLRDLIH